VRFESWGGQFFDDFFRAATKLKARNCLTTSTASWAKTRTCLANLSFQFHSLGIQRLPSEHLRGPPHFLFTACTLARVSQLGDFLPKLSTKVQLLWHGHLRVFTPQCPVLYRFSDDVSSQRRTFSCWFQESLLWKYMGQWLSHLYGLDEKFCKSSDLRLLADTCHFWAVPYDHLLTTSS